MVANVVAVVYHGLPVEDYPFGAEGEDYLAFLGRVSPEKVSLVMGSQRLATLAALTITPDGLTAVTALLKRLQTRWLKSDSSKP